MNQIKAEYIDHMGDDLRVVNAARISYITNDSNIVVDERDEKLINYLADHKHYSPFEHCHLTVIINCPLYIRSQIHRHRTFSYNEVSRRYTSEKLEFYEPNLYRKQHDKSKQCSDGYFTHEANQPVVKQVKLLHNKTLAVYNDLIEQGVSREMARGILPQNLMTKFYMSGNLRNWAGFLALRLDTHAQYEVQTIAKQIHSIIKEKFPVSGKALLKI